MVKEELYAKIEEAVKEHFADQADVQRHDVTKNNGIVRNGLCVRYNGSNLAPTVYLDDYYEMYLRGKRTDVIVDEVISLLEEHLLKEEVDLRCVLDFYAVKENVCFKVVSAERNDLGGMPHRVIEDLAIVYYIDATFAGIAGSIAIRNELMAQWNEVTEEDLYKAAMVNTPAMREEHVQSMFDFMERIGGKSFLGVDEEMKQTFQIVSNNEHQNGASVIMYPGFKEKMYKQMNGNYFVIPSSIHEMICIKDIGIEDKDTLMWMIKEVNTSAVLPNEVLSDSLYYYDGSKNEFRKVS